MKHLTLILACFLCFNFSFSQKKTSKKKQNTQQTIVVQEPQEPKEVINFSEEDKRRVEKTKTIYINPNVFVELVFKSIVQVVRSGVPDMVLVKNEDNVVTIQALQDGVNSNISIKTADGLYYSYRIISASKTEIPLFYEVPIADAVNGQTKLIEDDKKKIVERMSEQEVAQTIYGYDGYIKNRNSSNYRNIHLYIKGIYIDKGKLFFLFNLANKSNIDYKIERFQFFTMPLKKSKKRIENEEKEFIPIFFYKPLTEIKANSKETMVAVFDQFTLNDQKKLEVTMTENGGERTLKLEIDSEKVVKAKQL